MAQDKTMDTKDEITFKRSFKLELRAKDHYEPGLPYHNFHHVIDTLAFGSKILKACQSENVQLNKNIVYLAILFINFISFLDLLSIPVILQISGTR